MQTKQLGSLLLLAGLLAPGLRASAAELIANGGFESDLAGWTVADETSSGTWTAWNGFFGPRSDLETPGPASGSEYAIFDQNYLAGSALVQSFTVAPGSSVYVTFDMFDSDYSGTPNLAGPLGTGLDPNQYPNQHVQVDLLSETADPLDEGSGVLDALYYGNGGSVVPIQSTTPTPYRHYAFDITSVVG